MKLYVCYGTFPTPRPGGHPCGNAHQALVAAGHEPEVQRVYGVIANERFSGRREVKRLTGSYSVPTLVLDDGTVIDGSRAIIAWADPSPAPS